MSESGQSGAPVANPAHGVDAGAMIDALRARGAERFDPVGFRFIEALGRRAAGHRDHARRIVDRRLARAVAEFGERLASAEREAGDRLARGMARFPEAADALRQRFEAGDFGGLQRLLLGLEAQGGGGPLAELLAHVRRHAPTDPTDGPAQAGGGGVGPQGELKALRHFRRTWARLNVDRQLSHALAQAPANAGPLNSHHLVLQALGQLRELSPAYLEQFMSYVDALLWLDQADAVRSAAQKNAVRGERDRKRKPGRANGG